MLHCWKCHQVISFEPQKIGFRTYCHHCNADQHVCKNCRHHATNKHNECTVPGTEWIKDREMRNYCEDFEAKRLQITAEVPPPKNQLDSLFKD